MTLQAPPQTTLFSRSDLTDLAGISDGVAAFWIRNGLLLPTSGGEGRGSHRRFDRMQVVIAAVLAELQRFGLNLGALKDISNIFQRGIVAVRKVEVEHRRLSVVLRIAENLHFFRNGHDVYVKDVVKKYDRPACSDLEVALEETRLYFGDDQEASDLLRQANKFDFSRHKEAQLYDLIVQEMDDVHHSDTPALLLWQQDNEWEFDLSLGYESGFQQAENTISGIYISIGTLIRKIWSIDREARERKKDEDINNTLHRIRAERKNADDKIKPEG